MPKSRERADKLVADLLNDPLAFNARGEAHELLQEYFRGHPLDSLRDLLSNPNVEIQRAALFVASELPARQAGELYRAVVPLLHAEDVRLVYEAMEVIAIGCVGGEEYAHVLRQLEHPDSRIRVLAMFLAARSDSDQLRGALRGRADLGPRQLEHEVGIELVLADGAQERERLVKALGSPDGLERKYAAIGIARSCLEVPEMKRQLRDVDDADIRAFAAKLRRGRTAHG